MQTEYERCDHDQKLMAALTFDADDLDANRHGYMSKKQRKILSNIRRLWKIWIVLIILVTPISLIFAILDGFRIGDTVSSRFGLCCFILIFASGLTYYAYRKLSHYTKDLLKGDILEVSGIIKRLSFTKGQAVLYVAGESFSTHSPDRFYGFISEEKYRIFYAPYSRYILSAQLLEKFAYEQEAHPILKANPPII